MGEHGRAVGSPRVQRTESARAERQPSLRASRRLYVRRAESDADTETNIKNTNARAAALRLCRARKHSGGTVAVSFHPPVPFWCVQCVACCADGPGHASAPLAARRIRCWEASAHAHHARASGAHRGGRRRHREPHQQGALMGCHTALCTWGECACGPTPLCACDRKQESAASGVTRAVAGSS